MSTKPQRKVNRLTDKRVKDGTAQVLEAYDESYVEPLRRKLRWTWWVIAVLSAGMLVGAVL